MIKSLLIATLLASSTPSEIRPLLSENNIVDGACFIKSGDSLSSSIQVCTLPLYKLESSHRKYIVYTVYTKRFPHLNNERLVIEMKSGVKDSLIFDEARIEKISDQLYKTTYVLEIGSTTIGVLNNRKVKNLSFETPSFSDSFALSIDEISQIAIVSSLL